jgi:hypothetical protein
LSISFCVAARASSLRSPPLLSFCWAVSTCLFFAVSSASFLSRSVFTRLVDVLPSIDSAAIRGMLMKAIFAPSGNGFDCGAGCTAGGAAAAGG